MSRQILMAVTAWVVVGLVSSRVLVDPPKQDRPSLAQLLQQSDPHENDIFSALVSRRVSATPRAPPRPSPTQHLLESLLRPRYVDASEFRRLEVLPPALDINRQLTLLSASKRIRPPVDFVHPVLAEESSGTIYFPNTSPLFREDFRVQKIADDQENEDNQEGSSVGEELSQRADQTAAEPKISSSVSVSTSVSNTNESLTTLESGTSSDTSTTDIPFDASLISTTLAAKSFSDTTPPTTTITTSTGSPSVVFQPTSVSDNAADTPRSSTQVVEAEIILHPEESDYPERSGRQLAFEAGADYPDYPDYSDYEAMSPLSPLAHILGGLGSEFDSYGGDFHRSEFISSFRPDGF